MTEQKQEAITAARDALGREGWHVTLTDSEDLLDTLLGDLFAAGVLAAPGPHPDTVALNDIAFAVSALHDPAAPSNLGLTMATLIAATGRPDPHKIHPALYPRALAQSAVGGDNSVSV